MKANKGQDFFFVTDKGPNIVSQYDFWTITIFTRLGLALKTNIFRIFLSKVFVPSVARNYFSTIKHDKK
jgi:hypothetical protein